MWIVNFFKELKAWRIVRKTCKEHTNELLAVGLKYDWFGRLYRVINRDVDIELGSGEDEVYLRKELSEITAMLIKLNIMDILAYELKPLESERELEDGKIEYEHAYLVTLTPAWNLDRQYVTWKSILFILILLAAIIYCGIRYIPMLF